MLVRPPPPVWKGYAANGIALMRLLGQLPVNERLPRSWLGKRPTRRVQEAYIPQKVNSAPPGGGGRGPPSPDRRAEEEEEKGEELGGGLTDVQHLYRFEFGDWTFLGEWLLPNCVFCYSTTKNLTQRGLK